VEDPAAQSLKVQVRDSHLTGRTVLGHVTVPLRQLPADCTLDAWLPVEGVDGGRAGEVHLQLTYKVLPCDHAQCSCVSRESVACRWLQQSHLGGTCRYIARLVCTYVIHALHQHELRRMDAHTAGQRSLGWDQTFPSVCGRHSKVRL